MVYFSKGAYIVRCGILRKLRNRNNCGSEKSARWIKRQVWKKLMKCLSA